MPLQMTELAVGVVAYFDVAELNTDARIRQPANPTPRPGPFVCFAVKGTRSAWTPLTYTKRKERLEIADAWRIHGTAAWRNKTPYLNDGAITYVGDNQAFVDAAAVADTYKPETRQHISEGGIVAIVAEITKRGGATL